MTAAQEMENVVRSASGSKLEPAHGKNQLTFALGQDLDSDDPM